MTEEPNNNQNDQPTEEQQPFDETQPEYRKISEEERKRFLEDHVTWTESELGKLPDEKLHQIIEDHRRWIEALSGEAKYRDIAEEKKYNDKVIEFLIEDYKLKVYYLSNHFTRILTRFNFFVSIQLALFGALGFFLFGTNRDIDAAIIPIILGLTASIIWFAIGAQDRRLVVIYRGGMKLAAKAIYKAFGSKVLHGWTDKYFVGSYEGVLYKDKKILTKDGEFVKIEDLGFIKKVLFRLRNPISITMVPAIISAILILLWSGIWFLQYNNKFIFDPNLN